MQFSITLSHREEGNPAISNNMGEPEEHSLSERSQHRSNNVWALHLIMWWLIKQVAS